MKRCEFVKWLITHGYVSGMGRVWYHPSKPRVRYIVDDLQVRFETADNPQGTSWTMERHGNILEMSVNPENNRIRGMKPAHI